MHRVSIPVNFLLDQRILAHLEMGRRGRKNGPDVVRGRSRLSTRRRLHRRNRFAALAEVGQRARKLQKNQDRVSRSTGNAFIIIEQINFD